MKISTINRSDGSPQFAISWKEAGYRKTTTASMEGAGLADHGGRDHSGA